MLLRNSISKTKKFFQRTIQRFKSFMSNNGRYYHKLPKTSPFNPFSCNLPRRHRRRSTSYNMSYKELEKFYPDFTNQWAAAAADNEDKETIKKITSSAACATKQERKEEEEEEEDDDDDDDDEEKRTNLVAERLKEMAMMDVGNLDHLLDIEEVLHYYSRLTCPAYLDIVDKFFMDMYSEFFDPMASSTCGINNSRPRPRYR